MATVVDLSEPYRNHLIPVLPSAPGVCAVCWSAAHYKYDVDLGVRARLGNRLAAVLWRFLGQHEKHIADAVGVPEFEIVATVPGTREHEGGHPLERIVGTTVGPTKDRYEPLLALGQGGITAVIWSRLQIMPGRWVFLSA